MPLTPKQRQEPVLGKDTEGNTFFGRFSSAWFIPKQVNELS